MYHPHTIDATVLQKRTKEDWIFQLLASLSPNFKDLRSHILMNLELPYLKSVCATIKLEEIHRKMMSWDTNSRAANARVYHAKAMSRSENSGMSDYHALPWQATDERTFKRKWLDLKCSYCYNIGHLTNRYWQLYPEIKPRFAKEQWGYKRQSSNYKSNLATHTTQNFTTNLVALIQDFANYLQDKHGHKKA